MAEMEIGVLGRQCLNRRIPDIEQMRAEVTAWAAVRNNKKAAVHRQFTTPDIRIQKKYGPSIHSS